MLSYNYLIKRRSEKYIIKVIFKHLRQNEIHLKQNELQAGLIDNQYS